MIMIFQKLPVKLIPMYFDDEVLNMIMNYNNDYFCFKSLYFSLSICSHRSVMNAMNTCLTRFTCIILYTELIHNIQA